MKYHIDTIPIWDAYRKEAEPNSNNLCPLCGLEHKTEAQYIESFLGGSVMEPATRIEVNEKGFCTRHFKQLEGIQNRLGLALLAQTHAHEVIQKQKEHMRRLSAPQKGGLLRRGESPLAQAARAVEDAGKSCIACDRLRESMRRYAYTVAYMVIHEPGFEAAFRAAGGVCLPHYALLLRAAEEMGGKASRDFTRILIEVEEAHLDQLESHLDAFTRQFDYRNRDKVSTAPPNTVPLSLRILKGPEMD